MNKHMKHNKRLVGISVLIVAILIGCDSGGETETPPAGPSNLHAWGRNSSGQLGIGNETDQTTPVAITSTEIWKQVSAGGGHTMAIDSDDHLFAWGYNGKGQLGIGNETDQNTPIAITSTKTWKQVSAGFGHTMAIDSDNHLFAWGLNNYGQLGIGNETDQNTPIAITSTKTWKQVSAGGNYTMAIDSDNHLFAWGLNNYGQLGIGNETDQNTPIAITSTKTWKQVSAGGGNYTMAIDNDDYLFAWGLNNYGQLGIGTETVEGNEVLVDKKAPVQVIIATDTTKTWKYVSAGGADYLLGDGHTMAIDSTDHLFAWGLNNAGQLGIGNTDDQNTPIAIISTKTWKQVSAMGIHTIALDSDDHLFTWGGNNKGQLGNGNTTNQNTPVAIESTKTWDQISAGEYHSIGIIQ